MDLLRNDWLEDGALAGASIFCALRSRLRGLGTAKSIS